MKKSKLLARKTTIKHPNGTQISTPLLVPSFSSKGFLITNEGKSELNNIYKKTSEYITDAALISAFDVSNKHIENVNYSIANITFVDSGGYEVSNSYDLSTINYTKGGQKNWTEKQLNDVYKNIPNDYTVVLVNFDHPDYRFNVEKQIDNAKVFFSKFPNHLHTLLIKPETQDESIISVPSIVSNIRKIDQFDILGLTEKELGNSILERMTNIAKIRMALDNISLHTPLHIYGSLDPISTILYFISGAEIFDGLTWLRYGFFDGIAGYYSNYGVLKYGIDRDDDSIKLFMIQNNLSYLVTMKNQMKKFLLEGNFKVFDREYKFSDCILNAYQLLRTEIGG
jgi:hypothetical protein